ncbi:ABC transporter permease [Mediterraneibacter glycyrrhizinilyticus]|nr:ABC transporter permease [Mediterraneibacter glycyrrhizinilyticus]MBM6803846.1 ABC transporter permease [Mediterraneibacter glycyrrhizinilyticus]
MFLKEMKKTVCSVVYLLFLALMIYNWYENFYGVTEKEIRKAYESDSSVYSTVPGGAILAEPDPETGSYGTKSEENPEKIMCGGTDKLIIEYLNNSYATYPVSYYKEVILDEEEQEKILEIIQEITGLNEEQISNLPDDYFPRVNGNIIHMESGAETEMDIAADIGEADVAAEAKDYTKHFISQVTYDRFKELMAEASDIIGPGSNYTRDNLLLYYGQVEMDYEEAVDEYHTTIYDDKVTIAFARLFCDYLSRTLGLYPVFLAVAMWMRDRRCRMQELINVKAIGTAKLIIVRYLALLAAVLIPVFLLSLESLVPLVEFSVETGIEIDLFAFAKYILWWLLPTSMIVLALGMFLTILTRTPVAVIVQLVWWFMDSSFTELSGDTGLFTLMIRHNLLNGSELIRQDLGIIWMNRGIMAGVAVLLVLLSIVIYDMKRGGKLEQKNKMPKWLGALAKRFSISI